MSKQSLDDILYSLLEAHDVLPYGRGCDKDCPDMHVDEPTLKAAEQAIVEAVEGLVPGPAKPKTDYDKGWNDCLNTVLQAIKEWQNHGE